jgi:hypothetical protein
VLGSVIGSDNDLSKLDKYSSGNEMFTEGFYVKCPLLKTYAPCKIDCSCTADGKLECGSSAPTICYAGPRGYQGRYPCICFESKELGGSDDTPKVSLSLLETLSTKVSVEMFLSPAKTTVGSAWPSMLHCPDKMPLETKKVCYEKCGCVKSLGKVCLDGVPQDCKTKCSCSETAFPQAIDASSDMLSEATSNSQLSNTYVHVEAETLASAARKQREGLQHILALDSTQQIVSPEPISDSLTGEPRDSIVDGQVEASTLSTWTFIGFQKGSCNAGVINLSVSDNSERCLNLDLSVLYTTFRDDSKTWGVCAYHGAGCANRAQRTAMVPKPCEERNLLEASVRIKRNGENC